MTQSNMSTLINLNDVTTKYTFLDDKETDLVIDHVISHILSVGKTPSQNQWNDAWEDISRCDSPKYFKPRFTIEGQGIYRFQQKYIKSHDLNLEKKFHDELLKNIQQKYLTNIDCVVEFGCGTGHNLQKIRSRNANIKVFGSDWADSSQKILDTQNIPSWNFDMTVCDGGLDFPSKIIQEKNVCFLTIGSMEQLGNKWHKFFEFMRDFKPKKSIHIEPIIELYDDSNPIDSLAIKYHKKRNYLHGFFDFISNQKELKFYERTYFGNVYNEGFTVLELEYE